MSFSLTTAQVRARSKTVTRRMGWRDVRAGDRLMAIEKGMGLRKGERQVELGVIEVVAAWPERLDQVEQLDVEREGFPELDPSGFVEMFCEANRCRPSADVMRIEFRYVDASGTGDRREEAKRDEPPVDPRQLGLFSGGAARAPRVRPAPGRRREARRK